jgi:hypothetical protein
LFKQEDNWPVLLYHTDYHYFSGGYQPFKQDDNWPVFCLKGWYPPRNNDNQCGIAAQASYALV